MGDGFRPLGELGPLGLDAGLLSSQHVGIYEVLVTELQEALLLLLERVEAAAGAFGLTLGDLELLLSIVVDTGPNAVLRGGRKTDVALVVALDGALDVIDRHVRPVTGHAASAASLATEVVIDPTVAFDVHEQQTAATDAAVDRALQVVLVLARAVAAERVRL